MADVIPFVCWRPRPELAREVAAAPYDTFSRAEAAREVAAHPLSFLRIDKPAALFGSEVDEYDAQVYERARAELDGWYEQGILVPDSGPGEPALPAYFIYRLTQGAHTQTGVVACVSVASYQSGAIKRHENTRAHKEQDRVEHIQALEAHTGPVLLTYPSAQELDGLLKACTATARPLYDFIAPDGVHHELWRVDDADTTRRIRVLLSAIPTLYIADGHHRAAAAAQVAGLYAKAAKEKAELGEGELGEGELEKLAVGEAEAGETGANYFLAALFGSDELQLLDYNRVVSDLAGSGPEELLASVGEVMDVEEKGSEPYRPVKRGEFGMYLGGTWYRLRLREHERPADVVDGLDVALLHSTILAPLLKIRDPRSDPRIAYVGGARGLAELARRADATGGVAFALYPCSLAELFAVADEDRLMPPKSTWFEPKPRSGLAIHRIA
ncbi:MAG: DUF1015 family protein [Coriobacteriales bacterium]|jgi:uncharacterized protein (DUF1015 family)|nr:DUF1015 family protein [Coriobacteriales bacterium]